MKLKNKVIVVTGAGSGIGRALATALAKEGAKLALCSTNPDRLQATVDLQKMDPVNCFHKSVDVSSKEELTNFAASVVDHFGHVDMVINNAGIALGKYSAVTIPESLFRRLMEVNFWGMVYGSQVFLPYLIQQKEAGLVNISSLFGMIGMGYQAPYCASKFAIRGYTESLIMELEKTAPHVLVSSVYPGGVSTNIAKSSIPGDPDLGNHESMVKDIEEKQLILSPEKAAQMIIKGIKKKKSRILVGNDAKLLDKIMRFSPSLSHNLLKKDMP